MPEYVLSKVLGGAFFSDGGSMLQSSLLYYKKFRNDIKSIGFEVNPYDPCVANRIVNER